MCLDIGWVFGGGKQGESLAEIFTIVLVRNAESKQN
jgi:hypothetical protein